MDRIDPAQAHNIAERIAAFNERRMRQGIRSSIDKPVSCPYCNDRRYLMIEYAWVMDDQIPADVDAAQYLSPMGSDPNRTMIPCDCHGGESGPKDKPKPVRKFQDLFGARISSHWYGRKLIEARRKAASQAREIYNPNDHMHQSEAWEVLDEPEHA